MRSIHVGVFHYEAILYRVFAIKSVQNLKSFWRTFQNFHTMEVCKTLEIECPNFFG